MSSSERVNEPITNSGLARAPLARPQGWLAGGLIALLMAGVAACGFQLQGRTKLPERLSLAHIDTVDEYSAFTRALRDGLESSGARLTTDRALASAVVRVLEDRTGQQVLSVSARNTPREFEVFYEIRYAVESQGREILAPQRLRLTRDYSYDETALLAKQREEELLRETLARELSALVLRRLATL